MAENMWGDELECLSARRCRIGGIAGDAGTSSELFLTKSKAPVFKLSWLGFRFMPGILGLMNEGDGGSVATNFVVVVIVRGGCIDRPFMFLGFRGAGDVIGRPKV
jgi:hypothetical protein